MNSIQQPQPTKVVVTDVNMEFMSMVVFMIKWAFAAIPAAIIVGVTLAILGAVLGGVFAGFIAAI